MSPDTLVVSDSLTAAAINGIRISWWPIREYPRPVPAVGRETTLVCGR